MAKSKAIPMSPMMDPDHDEYQTRDDVNTLMRADEIHSDGKRHKRALSRMSSTLSRNSGKKQSRSRGRSGGR